MDQMETRETYIYLSHHIAWLGRQCLDWQACFADLEFKQDLNPGIDGQALVDHLLQLVAQHLKVQDSC